MLLRDGTQVGGSYDSYSDLGAEGFGMFNGAYTQPPEDAPTLNLNFSYFERPDADEYTDMLGDETLGSNELPIVYLGHEAYATVPVDTRAAAERRRAIQQSCLGLLQLGNGDKIGALIHVHDGDSLESSIVFAMLRARSPLDEPGTSTFAKPVARLSPGVAHRAMSIEEGEMTVAATDMRYDSEAGGVLVQHVGDYETSLAGEGFGAQDFAKFPWMMDPIELALFLENQPRQSRHRRTNSL